jgi:hypothetical protein
LVGAGLVLRITGYNVNVSANGSYEFPPVFKTGDTFLISVQTQPTNPVQLCTVSNASGTFANESIANVNVSCQMAPGNLRTSVVAPSYTAASAELELYVSINDARSDGAFGLLQQDIALDAAARAHAQYLVTHFYSPTALRFDPDHLGQVTASGAIAAHAEDNENVGFTGLSPSDRALAAGYSWSGGFESAAFAVGPSSKDCSDQFLDSALLKRRVLSTDVRDIGVGIVATQDGHGFACVVLTSYGAMRGQAPWDWIGTYPVDGQTNISVAMSSDPSLDTLGRVRGEPITIMVDHGNTISTSIVTMRKIGASTDLPIVIATNATLPNEISSNQIIIVPQIYLDKNTAYAVHVVGNAAGLAFDKTITFTTGAKSSSARFTPTAMPGTVRTVFAYPTDRFIDPGYVPAIQSTLEHIQGWYQQQLGGETFQLYSDTPQVCALPQNSAYYLDGTWDKVSSGLQSCATIPIAAPDADYDWVVYADVNHGCNLPGRLGAATLSLTMLARMDVEGVMDRDPAIDDCGNPIQRFGVSRFVGGLGHELGHSMTVPHPAGCDAGQSNCDFGSIMWTGFYDYPAAYFSASERSILLSYPFINLQRFAK